jgi:hypothetical protein
MKCWRWLLVVLVGLTLGHVLAPSTSSAAGRSVQAAGHLMGDPDGGNGFHQSARGYWADGDALMGDPDTGGGGYGGDRSLHDVRLTSGSGYRQGFRDWLLLAAGWLRMTHF